MSWNYRVVKGEEGLRIFDVYYNDAGQPIGSNLAPTYVHGETVDDLRAQLQLMTEALAQPVLAEADIGSASSPNARAE